MKLLGDLQGKANIAAWVLAAGAALAWQMSARKRDNAEVFSAAEAAAWNSKKKAEQAGGIGQEGVRK